MYILNKKFQNFIGVDLKSTDLLRNENFASDVLNAQVSATGSIEKRKGFQAKAEEAGYSGLFTYSRTNTTTGVVTPIVLAVSDTVKQRLESVLTISYSGTAGSALLTFCFSPDDEEFKLTVLEDNVETVSELVGVGVDEVTPVTIGGLATLINLITGFNATVTGDSNVPAAFLDVVRSHDLVNAGDASLSCFYWEDVNQPTTPFANHYARRFETDFENVSGVQIQNVMYLSSGFDDVYKYDGQNLYRAGLPTPGSVSAVENGAGAISGSNYDYIIQYIQKDAVGNFIEGNYLRGNLSLHPSNKKLDVTVANIQAGTNFNTNGAIVNGAQVAVTTIVVDSGHTLKVGDTAYFYDSVSASYVEREVTAKTNTSISIGGAAVTVADNAVISNNLRIAIYRSKNSATTPELFYLVAEIPNDSFSSTQLFTDNLADASLGAEFVFPLTDRSAPPKGKYITIFQNHLMIGGNPAVPNTFYWSDTDGVEYFPADDNAADCNTVAGDVISGLGQNGEIFMVFKDHSIFAVSGDLTTNQLLVEQITNDIGCASHATINEVRGALYFLSEQGPRFITGGQLPKPLGQSISDPSQQTSRIDPVINEKQRFFVPDEQKFRLKRSVAVNDRANEKYLIYIPAETFNGTERYQNSYSRVFTYDYSRDAWFIWNNLNFSGGVSLVDNQIFFIERRWDVSLSSFRTYLYRISDNNDPFDYEDHNEPISFEFKSQWEFLGDPAIFKRFLTIRVFSTDIQNFTGFDLDIETETDFIKDATKATFTMSFGSQGYGETAWGTSSYGDPWPTTLKHKLGGGRWRSMRTIFKNSNHQEQISLAGWELQIATPYKPVMHK